MFASVTRLRVRSVFYLPEFAWRTFLTQRQTVRAEGFVGGRLLVDRKYTFWTLTVWENEQTMKRFRGSGPHAKVMRKLPQWCDEASYAHWNTDTAAVPTWDEAYKHLIAEGKLSRVENPSEAYETRQYDPPRFESRMSQELRPVRAT